jgi:glycosyltransferase involved in cell wall biosynthesis
MPQVSVIVPTFNAGDALIESVRSALEQSFRDIEILVIDDGSSDESAMAILRRMGPDPQRAETLWRQRSASSTGTCGFGFWTGDIPLHYLYQSNRGMGTARNRGLQIAHGEFIAFLEPDYVWEKDHLLHHIEFFNDHPDAWIAHSRVVPFARPIQRNGRKKSRTTTAMSFAEVVAGTGVCASAIVIRRRCLEAHGCFDENLPSCEDYDLWIRIAAHVPIHQIQESVVLMKRAPAVPSWSLDRYRVYALEKAFQSGHLNADQRHRVAEEMVDRCDILVEGYRKRNNTERANFYDRKKKKFELEVSKLISSDSKGADRARVVYEENNFSPAR